MGKDGYVKKRFDWLVKDPIDSLITSEELSDTLKERSGRGYDWIRARVKKNEEGGYYVPKDHTKEVFKKLVII